MLRAIFGTVQDTLVFVIFCLNMLYLSKNWCFKSIFLFFYILGLKVQKPTKNHRFLEKFNIFYIVISKYILLSPYIHIKQLHSYQNTILTFAEHNCLFFRGETIYRLTVYRGTQASVRFTVRGGLETVR